MLVFISMPEMTLLIIKRKMKTIIYNWFLIKLKRERKKTVKVKFIIRQLFQTPLMFPVPFLKIIILTVLSQG